MRGATILLVVGTRPEAIKLAPVYGRLVQARDEFVPLLCSTGQHSSMLEETLRCFNIEPDFRLDVMTHDQPLSRLTARVLVGITEVIDEIRPRLLIVQGDTTSAVAAALAAFYERVSVAHVEAGLRTGDVRSPFPEELNRCTIDRLSDFLFAPTDLNKGALIREGIAPDKIFVTGNTVVDALLSTRDRVRTYPRDHWRTVFAPEQYSLLAGSDALCLVTLHRREIHGSVLFSMATGIRDLAEAHPGWHFFVPVHLNPSVQQTMSSTLSGMKTVHLLPPLDYDTFVFLMDRAQLILTDSGGIQEEAPSLGKPVIVMRDKTERQEGVESGNAFLVGLDPGRLRSAFDSLTMGTEAHPPTASLINPYGDGKASDRIVGILRSHIWPEGTR